jgi:hypothetical protein
MHYGIHCECTLALHCCVVVTTVSSNHHVISTIYHYIVPMSDFLEGSNLKLVILHESL